MHYVHLGRVGLVANFRWGEMADFILGWTTLDIAHDDGRGSAGGGGLPARETLIQ